MPPDMNLKRNPVIVTRESAGVSKKVVLEAEEEEEDEAEQHQPKRARTGPRGLQELVPDHANRKSFLCRPAQTRIQETFQSFYVKYHTVSKFPITRGF